MLPCQGCKSTGPAHSRIFFSLRLRLKQCVMVSNEIFQCGKIKHFDSSVYVCFLQKLMYNHCISARCNANHWLSTCEVCRRWEDYESSALQNDDIILIFFFLWHTAICKVKKQNKTQKQIFPSAHLRILPLALLRWILVFRFILGFIKIVWNRSKKNLSCISVGVSF